MMPQAMLFTGPGEPLRAVPQCTAPPRGGEIRVRILCCTLCKSDLSTFSGHRREATPTILGHEVVGTIEAFGPDASHRDAEGRACAPGERITWAVVANCGSCEFCSLGLPQKCERGLKYGHHAANPDSPDGGGLAETITLAPGTAWFRIPDGIPDAVAALANCSMATAVAVLEAAGELKDRSVLVFGSGLLGLIACAMAKGRGAASVIALDPDAGSRERSLRFGASAALNPLEGDWTSSLPERGCDIALELAGRSETVALGLKHIRVGGTLVLAGTVSPTPAVPLDPQTMVRRMLTVKGVHNYRPDHLGTALRFLGTAGRNHPWDSLIAGSFPLQAAEAAFAAALANPGRRIAVVPPSV
jgi:alcohol dehydrogenase